MNYIALKQYLYREDGKRISDAELDQFVDDFIDWVESYRYITGGIITLEEDEDGD